MLLETADDSSMVLADKISGMSLEIVGRTMLESIRRLQQQ